MTETKTTEQQNAEWNKAAFEGAEPFNDGVTPEVLAKHAQRAAEAKAKKDKAEAQKARRFELRSREPLQEIARQLKRVVFEAPLTEEEMNRTKEVLCDCGQLGKDARRDVHFTFYKYFRAGFSASGGMNVLVMKLATPSEACDVFRIADMARVLFWKHRKPGYLGAECGDEHLNYSLKRAELDISANADIVTLLQNYKTFLLESGVFSEDPQWVKNPVATRRAAVHYRTSTVMAAHEALMKRMADREEQISNLAESDASLAQRLTAAQTDLSDLKNGREVLSQKFATLDRWHAEHEEKIHTISVAQEVHKQNLITLNTELSKVENEALARHAHTINALNAGQSGVDSLSKIVGLNHDAITKLEEKLGNVLNIALRLMNRVEVLEGVRLNVTTGDAVTYFPPVPRQQPVIVCEQKGVEQTPTVVG